MEKTQDNPLVSFVFADINNNLCIKMNSGELKFLNSEYELDTILQNLE